MITNCPFCENDEDGCCFCDHSGRIKVGPEYGFHTLEEVEEFRKTNKDTNTKPK